MRGAVAALVALVACTAEPVPVAPDAASTSTDAPDAADADAGPRADAGEGDTDAAVARFHPPGYLGAEVHGRDLTTGVADCRTCHGTDLAGLTGVGPSCDGCHPPDWRTTCTFCHGGAADLTGAPPRDLRGLTEREAQTFRPHPEHVALGNHRAYDCTECHTKPTDVLSDGHVFDDSPGAAEVTFEHGLSAGGVYEGGGSCTNLYCHGNGRTRGAYTHERARPTCDTCHAGPTSTRWASLSGRHADHLREGVRCFECHSRTVDGQGDILNGDVHVNGVKDLDFASGQITRTNGQCSGSCHLERHVGRTWN